MGQAKRRGLPRPAGPADPEAAAAAEARDAGGAFGGSESEEDLTVGDTTHPDLSDSDVEAAVEGYVRALERLERGEGPTPREMGARDAGAPRLAPPEPYAHVESESDSSEDDDRNTVGNVPLEWYRHEDHLGYDREGRAIGKGPGGGDALDELIKRSEGGKSWRTLYDPYNGEEITLTGEEVRMIMRIRQGRFPHVEVNPFEEYSDWFSSDVMPTPLRDAPEPKSRFVPSKWEAKKVVKLVRALRRGWLRRKEQDQVDEVYLMWGDDHQATAKTSSGLTYIPAPKPKLPGHEESYRPPPEYVGLEEPGTSAGDEEAALKPQTFGSYRQVPSYARFIRERFERCLDLYLCPRVRRRRFHIDPEVLKPKLPSPSDLEPFPKFLCIRFRGHTSAVACVDCDPSGHLVASGDVGGTVRLWECGTGRCLATWDLDAPIAGLAFRPAGAEGPVLAVAAGCAVRVFCATVRGFTPPGADADAISAALAAVRDTPGGGEGGAGATWRPCASTGGVRIDHQAEVSHVSWHARGAYLLSVCPGGLSRSVVVHHLPKGASQCPFRKNRGVVRAALFHPSKPFLFVATDRHVRVYNLTSQGLAKKLMLGGAGHVLSMDVHPSGDHLAVGVTDGRVCWFDLDLSASPYRSLRHHTLPVTSVAFHPRHPLLATASDDGTCHVLHGMVYADLMTNPLVVPVRVLRAHKETRGHGVQACRFHPKQPWVLTAGADGDLLLFCD